MKRRSWLQWAGSIALTAVLIGSSTTSCSSSADSPPEPTCVRDKTPFSLGADNYADVGKLGDAKGTSQPFVAVYDEQHASRVGQVEIASMLNRLYRAANLRHLALEGSVLEKPSPDLAWFTSLPDASIRGAVALQLLRQGEVSAAEFAAMVLPGFQLHPIEHDTEYQVDLSGAASRSYTAYLVAIAFKMMTPDQIAQAEALLDQDKAEEAIRFIVGTNEWTSQRYQILKRTTPVVSTDEMQKLGAELEEKAQEVGADVADYRSDLDAARKFFDTATQRSKTMAANTADLATARVGDCAPIAMNIGAAHTTQVTGLLNQRNMSYAVVSPLSLSSDNDNGSLSTEAYDCKVKGRSVDSAGALGAFVEGRRKPPPSSQNDWFKTKAQLSFATVVIAREAARAAAAAGGAGQPPFNLDQQKLGLGGSGPDSPNITIDLSTISEVPADDKTRHDVIFKVTLKQGVALWIRTGVVAAPVDFRPDDWQTLERALKQLRDELKQEHPTDEPKSPPQPQVVTLTPDVKAAIAQTREEALKAAI